MIQYERIDISNEIDFNNSDKSKECMICHYWCFKDSGFKYQPYFCNGCHDFSMTVQNLSGFFIVAVKKMLIVGAILLALIKMMPSIC